MCLSCKKVAIVKYQAGFNVGNAMARNKYIYCTSDAEKELGVNPVIGSVNFGATRDFVIRRNDDNAEKN